MNIDARVKFCDEEPNAPFGKPSTLQEGIVCGLKEPAFDARRTVDAMNYNSSVDPHVPVRFWRALTPQRVGGVLVMLGHPRAAVCFQPLCFPGIFGDSRRLRRSCCWRGRALDKIRRRGSALIKPSIWHSCTTIP